MANEILSDGGGGASTIVASFTSDIVIRKLADRNALRNLPSLVRLSPNMIGALAEKIAILGVDGNDRFSSQTEIQSVSNTAFANAAATCTPGRYSMAYETSDWAVTLDPTGAFQPLRLANSIVANAMMTFSDNLAAMMAGFSTVVGGADLQMTHDIFLAAVAKMRINFVEPPWSWIIDPLQFTQWSNDLETRPGVTAFRRAAEDMQILRGGGYQGTYDGVEIYTSGGVTAVDAAANYAGGMFGYGAIAYKEVELAPAPQSAVIVVDAGPIRVEEVRDGTAGKTKIVGQYWHGFVEVQNDAGVLTKSRAT